MRSLRALLVLVACAAAGCPLADVAIDDDVFIECTGDDCPTGYTCQTSLGRCTKDDGDKTAPTLKDAALSRDRAGVGVPVVLTFDTSEPLAQDPVVRLADGTPFVREPSEAGFRYSLAPDGDEEDGPQTIEVDLVDAFGNEATAIAAGNVTLDFDPPAIVSAVASDDVVADGQVVEVTITSSEPLVEPATALLVPAASGADVITMSATSGAAGDTQFTFRWTHRGTERTDVPYALHVAMRDEADNAVESVPEVLIVFDDAAPTVDLASVHVMITTPAQPNEPLDAAPAGGLVDVELTVSEDLDDAPVLTAGPFTLPLDEAAGRTYRYRLAIDGSSAEGDHSISASLVDPAGNAAVVDDLAHFVVDRTAPTTPDVATPGAVVLRRVPYGDGATAGPSFTLRTGTGAVEANALVVVVAAEASQLALGSARADAAGVSSVQLVELDVPRPWVFAVDGAGNRSPVARVRDVEWLGAVADAVGAPILESRPWFDGALGGDARVAVGAAALVDGATMDTAGAGRWSAVGAPGAGAPPLGRHDLAAAYDAERGAAILFGGQLEFGTSCDDSGFFYCGGTWRWTNAGFERLVPGDPEGDGDPTPRFGHSMAYDPVRGRVVLFGGKDSSGACDDDTTNFCGGTWAWSGASWQQLVDGDERPAPRLNAAMAYDLGRDRLVLYGGISTADDALDCAGGVNCYDTFEHDGVEWHDVTFSLAGAPPPRSATAMAYDEARGVVVLFGGLLPNNTATAETWLYDGATWSKVTTSASPDPRFGHSMTYSRVLGRVVVFGGERKVGACEGGTSVLCSALWTYDGAGERWEQIDVDAPPPPRAGGVLVEGEALGGLVVAMGKAALATPCADGAAPGSSCLLADAWVYDGVWRQLAPGDPQADGDPIARTRAGLVTDPTTAQVLVAGGVSGVGPEVGLTDTWGLRGSSWVQLDDASLPAGPTGALVGWPGQDVARLDDLSTTIPDGRGPFLLSGTTWSEAPVPAGTPPTPRLRYAAAYDSARDVTVVFGGLALRTDACAAPPCVCPDDSVAHDGTHCASNETWEVSSAGWTKIQGAAPPARVDASVAYDAAAQRVVLFGGRRCTNVDESCDSVDDYDVLGDTWTYASGTWVSAAVDGPLPRAEHAMAFDPGRQRVVLFGGGGAAGSDCGTSSRLCKDVWEWNGTAWQLQVPAATSAGAPIGRLSPGLAADPRNLAVALFGGSGGLDDAWRWDGGGRARPAQVVHVGLKDIGAAGAEVAYARVTFVAGGSSADGPGVRALLWRDGAYRFASSSNAAAGAPARVDVVLDAPDEILRAMGAEGERAVHVAVTPKGDNGSADRGVVASDYVEVELHYRLP